jgi:chemotaxis protein MotB
MRNVKARRPRLPLFFTLGLSLLLHAALFRVQLPANLLKLLVPEPPTPQLALIELTPEVASTTNPTDQTEVRLLQDFRFSALERTAALEQTLANALSQQAETEAARQQQLAALEQTLANALSQQAETEATRQQQLAALETAQIALSGQVETLTVEKAELSAQLANERQRRAELEQQLQEARRAKEAELSGVRGTYDRLVAALKGEISQKEIALHQAKERLVVTILDRVLFPSGQATLTPAGQRVLEKVGVILAKVNDRRILIEGHTDNVPIGPALSMRFPTNWELSTARATEVVKYLIIQVKLPAERLSAVGRADTAPVASNVNEEGRQQNRRIEIILLPPEEQPGSIS